MYCPKCGTQNIEEAKFCRICGANVSLINQAMTGQLAGEVRRPANNKEKARLAQGFVRIALGVVFFLVLLIPAAFGHRDWPWWMLLPAFFLLRRGVLQVGRVVSEHHESVSAPARTEIQPPHRADELLSRDAFDVAPPPSVTENTTRHLDAVLEPSIRKGMHSEMRMVGH
jgi:hypothetical protein